MKLSKEFQVGLFMVLTIAILYLGFNYLRGVKFFEKTNKYYAKYDNVGGLTASNPVSISGYSVGRVSGVSIDQNDSNKVVVEMTIEGNIMLGKDAKAILDVGLLGETGIKIEPGNLSNPTQPGDTLYSELGPNVKDFISPVANSIQSTIQRVNAVLDKLTGSGDKINNMVDNLEQTTVSTRRFAVDMRTSLNEMVVGYQSVIENINTKVDEVTPVITKFGELADSLKAIDIKPTLLAAEKTLKEIDSLIARIDQSQGTFNKLIEDDELYNNLNSSVQSLDSLLIHIRSRPKDFFGPLGRDKPKGIRKD